MNASRLSLLTWNVWFDSLQREARYEEIFKVCRALAPDVICFQEATPFFLSMLKGDSTLSNTYSFSDNAGKSVSPYGTLSLCRKELGGVFQHTEMLTDMNRKLLTTRIETTRGDICIGNVHLESLDSAPVRREQLKVCSQVLTGTSMAFSVLCGDFNFCSDRNYHPDRVPLENDTLTEILPRFTDVWPQLYSPVERGYTFDTTANRMLTENHPHEQFRFDRVMFSAPSGSWAPSSIQMIGNAPVGENVRHLEAGVESSSAGASSAALEPAAAATSLAGLFSFLTPVKKKKPAVKTQLFPSDHFGLYAVFERTCS